MSYIPPEVERCLSFIEQCERCGLCKGRHRFLLNVDAWVAFVKMNAHKDPLRSSPFALPSDGFTINGHPCKRINSRFTIQLSILPEDKHHGTLDQN